ncbi:FecCD family ABC transporter permease [Pseudonocardia sp. CA-107938]|uniref:FecCD family ABC transporter permease n=1 Tax=Pseudonocardia sp. CA-107938 TaxID=3240021 RepID=UPI003D8D14FB
MTVARRIVVLCGACLVVLAVAGIGQVLIGRSGITPGQALDVVTGQAQSPVDALIVNLRVPRFLTGMLSGIALGSAGAALQSSLRNPLAEPGMLGISAGAALGVVIATGAGAATGRPVVLLAAAAGGLSAVGLITLAVRGRWQDSELIALAGVLVGSILTALVLGLLALAGRPLWEVLRWLIGSVNARTIADVPPVAALTAAGLLLVLGQVRPLAVLRLGAPSAAALGVGHRRVRAVAMVGAIVLAVGGVLGVGAVMFLGLVGPQIARHVTGSSHPGVLVPTGGLVAAALLPIADLIAQLTTLSLPGAGATGLPVGAVIAPLSIPVLLWLLTTRKLTVR